MLAHGLHQDDPRTAIQAAIALSQFIRYSGAGTTSLLEAAASAAGTLGDAALQAEALFRVSIVAYDRSDLDTAEALYSQAQRLFEQVGDAKGQANCIGSLGDIALDRSDYDTAQAHYQEAQPLFEQVGNLLGQANCTLRLGDIAVRRSQYDTAQARFRKHSRSSSGSTSRIPPA